MALALNLVVGVSGELSLGHAGFMSIGAFAGCSVAAALQNSVEMEPLRLALAMVLGGVIAGIFGFLIGVPVLRLNGDYLAIVTHRHPGLRRDHQESGHQRLSGRG